MRGGAPPAVFSLSGILEWDPSCPLDEAAQSALGYRLRQLDRQDDATGSRGRCVKTITRIVYRWKSDLAFEARSDRSEKGIGFVCEAGKGGRSSCFDRARRHTAFVAGLERNTPARCSDGPASSHAVSASLSADLRYSAPPTRAIRCRDRAAPRPGSRGESRASGRSFCQQSVQRDGKLEAGPLSTMDAVLYPVGNRLHDALYLQPRPSCSRKHYPFRSLGFSRQQAAAVVREQLRRRAGQLHG